MGKISNNNPTSSYPRLLDIPPQSAAISVIKSNAFTMNKHVNKADQPPTSYPIKRPIVTFKKVSIRTPALHKNSPDWFGATQVIM